MALADILRTDLEKLFRCPACGQQNLSLEPSQQGVVCADCDAVYPADFDAGLCSFLPAALDSDAKQDIRKWWGDLWRQRYADHDELELDELTALLDQMEDLFQKRQLLPAIEMSADLSGQSVLEIGSGAGGHSAAFARRGASVVALDITPERVMSTARKLDLISDDGRAYQGDAENLPFRDASFDIVYSNGVLHHSENTEKTIAEVYRVLKPGGKAVLMLYARHSSVFWLNVFPRGLVTGEMFRWPEPEWIGRLTEGKPKFGDTKNPFTRVYSRDEIKKLLGAFAIESLRKNSFQFDNVAMPRGTQMRNAVLKLFGVPSHPGARMIYGTDFYPETALELWLGKYIGFGWNIIARKPK